MDINILCLVCIASFLIFSDVIYANPTRSLIHKLYDNHRKRVTAFQRKHPCDEPVETLVPLSEVEFDEKIPANEQIFPEITVLHRCNGYAQCRQLGNRCEQETSEMVELTFFVSSIIDTSIKYYVTGRAQNHTSCSCQMKTS